MIYQFALALASSQWLALAIGIVPLPLPWIRLGISCLLAMAQCPMPMAQRPSATQARCQMPQWLNFNTPMTSYHNGTMAPCQCQFASRDKTEDDDQPWNWFFHTTLQDWDMISMGNIVNDWFVCFLVTGNWVGWSGDRVSALPRIRKQSNQEHNCVLKEKLFSSTENRETIVFERKNCFRSWKAIIPKEKSIIQAGKK